MILEIRDLSCRYVSRRKDTLSHVDLSLAEGEMVLIAGRSGCGKSTLIKSITGLLEPGEARLTGTISLDGRDVTEMSAEDIGLLAGTVYQTPDDQLFAMTVADEVGFALETAERIRLSSGRRSGVRLQRRGFPVWRRGVSMRCPAGRGSVWR